jgi:hypothetical protein
VTFVYDSFSVGSGTGDPVTFSHTCSANTKLLILEIFNNTDSSSRAGGVPTYNSVNMVDSGEGVVVPISTHSMEVFFLINPGTGSAYTVSIPNSGSDDLTMPHLGRPPIRFPSIQVTVVQVHRRIHLLTLPLLQRGWCMEQ